MSSVETSQPVDALLLIGPGCPHCAAVLEVLGKLVKEGQIGRLEVVNVARIPEQAAELGVRSVPWLRLGPFELEGAQTEGQLRHWIEQAVAPQGIALYFTHLLETGELNKVMDLVRAHPHYLDQIVYLAADIEQDLKIRLGIGAVFEELKDSELLKNRVPELGKLTKNPSAKVRADAAYFLSLSGSKTAVFYLKPLLQDESAEVREIAAEAMQELGY